MSPEQQTIERLDGITLILNDHRNVEELFTQYEQGGDPQTRMRLVAKMIEELSIHAQIEEEELYPVMQRVLPDGEELVSHAVEEHGEAKDLLAELEQMPVGSPDFDQKVQTLIEDVRHHVEEEESDMLARLREAMPEDDLVALGHALREAKSRASIHPKQGGAGPSGGSSDGKTRDELYEKAKELGVEGRSDMSKDELAQAVQREQS